MKRKTKHLDDKDFKMIKTLIDAGLSNKKIMDVSERGEFVISIIKKCISFDEYKKMVTDLNRKYHPEPLKVEVKPEQTKTDSQSEIEIRFEYKLLNRLDTIISLLNKIVERDIVTYTAG